MLAVGVTFYHRRGSSDRYDSPPLGYPPVWMIRGKIVITDQCCTVYYIIMHNGMHALTYEQFV